MLNRAIPTSNNLGPGFFESRLIVRAEIRAVPPLTGYRWDSFPKGAYDTHLRFGVGAVNEIVEQLNQFEKELSNSESP
jgi:hypothetical protein